MTERLRDRYPLFYAFATETPIDPEALQDSDANTRIRSIWPFAANKVRRFYASLKPRERANCDPEDILLDLYAMLVEKDASWQQERGKYITYAGRLIGRELLAIRDRARTVQSPRNATSRMREYQEHEEKGTLSDRRRETYEQLSRTVTNAASMPTDDIGWRADDDHVGEVEERDIDDQERRILAKVIRRNLTPMESYVVGWSSGLWGSGYYTNQEIADMIGQDAKYVGDTKASAYAKIRWYVKARRKTVSAVS